MTVAKMTELIQATVEKTTKFYAPYMELPPDEYTFCTFLCNCLTAELDRWLTLKKIEYENFPWKLEYNTQTHKVKKIRLKRPVIKIFKVFWEKGWFCS